MLTLKNVLKNKIKEYKENYTKFMIKIRFEQINHYVHNHLNSSLSHWE